MSGGHSFHRIWKLRVAAVTLIVTSTAVLGLAEPATTTTAPSTSTSDVLARFNPKLGVPVTAADALTLRFPIANSGVRRCWVAGDTIYLYVRDNVRVEGERSDGIDEPMVPAVVFSASPGLAPLLDSEAVAAQKRPQPQKLPLGQRPPTTGAIVALDSKTGSVRWVRTFVGKFLFTPDPGGRDIWAMADTFTRLDGQTGNALRTEVFDPRMLPQNLDETDDMRRSSWYSISAIRVGGQLSATATREGEFHGPLKGYDLDTRDRIDVQIVLPPLADARKRLELESDSGAGGNRTHIRRVSADLEPHVGRPFDWEFSVPGYLSCIPEPIGNDILIYKGGPEFSSRLVRLETEHGVPIWSTRLPRGAYATNSFFMRRFALVSDWPVAAALNDSLAYAIGDDGEVFILRSDTGQIIGSTRQAAQHLGPPALVDDQLIIAGFDSIVALPLRATSWLESTRSFDRRIEAAEKAILVNELDRADALVREAFELRPDDSAAWAARASVAIARRHEQDAVAAATRSIEFDRHPANAIPEVLQQKGLIARVPTGPLLAPIAALGLSVYAPSADGILYVLDCKSGDLTETREMILDAIEAHFDGNKLFARAQFELPQMIVATPQVPALSLRSDPLFRIEGNDAGELNGKPLDPTIFRSWSHQDGKYGAIFSIDGRQLRPISDGGTRELIRARSAGEKTTIVDHPPVLAGVRNWSLCRTTARTLACGLGGVFTVDENFRPNAKLIDYEMAPASTQPVTAPSDASTRPATRGLSPIVMSVDGDSETLAVLVLRPLDRMEIEIRSLDGKRLIRSEQVSLLDTVNGDRQAQFFKLGDGYFLASSSLVWVPTDPSRPVWRYSTMDRESEATRLLRLRARLASPVDGRDHSFGIPRIVGDRMFVPNRWGGVYVFDLNKIIH